LISVVIPVFNRERFIKRAIDSVLAQTLREFELIVVDDGSNDNTPLILKSYEDKIKVITTENRGVSHARNRGIEASKGSWVAFLDSDDEWHKDKLKLQREFHRKNGDILFSHTLERWIRDSKEIKQKKVHKKPSGYCFLENLPFCKIAPSTVMMHRGLFERVGMFDESLEVCEDYDLWLRVTKEFEVGLVEEVLTTKYAGHKDQLSIRHHSMDRYKIAALLKHKDRKEAKSEIVKKCEILIKGAKKRGNSEVTEYYERLLSSLLA
jgi:glycosyltransferase involved in cell wall biosynthesis